MQPLPVTGHAEEDLLAQEIGLAEVLILPRSTLIDHTLVENNFGDKYGVRELSISRRGQAIEDIPLTATKV
jgi:di/tricarboxylate transporter